MTHPAIYTRRIALCALFVGACLMPTVSFAAFVAPSTGSATSASARGVCLRITTLEGNFNKRLGDAGRAYAKAANNRAEKLRAHAGRRTLTDDVMRKDADAQFARYVRTLRERAAGDMDTDAAITSFADTVLQASALRRERVDQAQTVFVAGVQTLVGERRDEVTAIATSFKNDIDAALVRARAACDQGEDPKEVRLALHRALADLDTTYKARFADQSQFSLTLQRLTEDRRAALAQAAASFLTTLNEASQAINHVLQ